MDLNPPYDDGAVPAPPSEQPLATDEEQPTLDLVEPSVHPTSPQGDVLAPPPPPPAVLPVVGVRDLD